MDDGRQRLETLQRLREEKLRQIAEKRVQVEAMRQRRAERGGQNVAPEDGDEGLGTIEKKMREAERKEAMAKEEIDRSKRSLIAEILSTPGQKGAQNVSVEGPLKELRQHVSQLESGPCRADRALNFEQEFSVAAVKVDPAVKVHYDRSVQTDDPAGLAMRPALSEKDPNIAGNAMVALGSRGFFTKKPTFRLDSPKASANRRMSLMSLGSEPDEVNAKAAEAEARILNPQEREKVEEHPDFQAFFSKSTLIVERVLGAQDWDVAYDLGCEEPHEGHRSQNAESQEAMRYVEEYIEDRWAYGRPVMGVQFSEHHPELFLAAYGQREHPVLGDPEGCVLVWNVMMRGRPEAAFTCSSAVQTAQFHRHEPPLFYGGTYAGGIVMWDARAKKTPVMRSPLSGGGSGHAHPITGMQQVGTQNLGNLITSSNDGKLCVWSMAMSGGLMNPSQEPLDLRCESSKGRRDLGVMCMSFARNDTNTLYVGGEDGSVCQAQLHGESTGVTTMYDGHDGPVTAIHMHPGVADASGATVLGAENLALTSSFDWSLKLWMVKQHRHAVLCLETYEDYVYDVKWHPSHPAVFSAVDGEGHVDLWNLNASVESPACRLENPNRSRLALNRCDWSSDGRKLVTGDSMGALSMFSVDRTVAQPRGEDHAKFQEMCRHFEPIVQRAPESRRAAPSRERGP